MFARENMKSEIIIEYNPIKNIKMLKVNRYNSEQNNMIPKEKVKGVIEKTDSLSEVNQKCLPNCSKINLINPNEITKSFKAQLKMFNVSKRNETSSKNDKARQLSRSENILNMIKDNLIKFLTTPLENNIWLKGKIISSRERNIRILRYYIIDETNEPDILVMIAKKLKRNQYKLFANSNNNSNSVSIGKLSTNILGNYFKLKSFASNEVIEKIKYVELLFMFN